MAEGNIFQFEKPSSADARRDADLFFIKSSLFGTYLNIDEIGQATFHPFEKSYFSYRRVGNFWVFKTV